MTFRLRAAHASDIEPLYEMAKLTGGGFTNLPADKGTLRAKLARSADAFARIGCQPLAGIDRHQQFLILLNEQKIPPRPVPEEPKKEEAKKDETKPPEGDKKDEAKKDESKDAKKDEGKDAKKEEPKKPAKPAS